MPPIGMATRSRNGASYTRKDGHFHVGARAEQPADRRQSSKAEPCRLDEVAAIELRSAVIAVAALVSPTRGFGHGRA
jgi:hypothetical protein